MAINTYSGTEGAGVSLGQVGSAYLETGTDFLRPTGPTGGANEGVVVAISMLENTEFGDLIAESPTLTINSVTASGGAVTGNQLFPQGLTIYGRWTDVEVILGAVVVYFG